jgi:hypothetical protein
MLWPLGSLLALSEVGSVLWPFGSQLAPWGCGRWLRDCLFLLRQLLLGGLDGWGLEDGRRLCNWYVSGAGLRASACSRFSAFAAVAFSFALGFGLEFGRLHCVFDDHVYRSTGACGLEWDQQLLGVGWGWSD